MNISLFKLNQHLAFLNVINEIIKAMFIKSHYLRLNDTFLGSITDILPRKYITTISPSQCEPMCVHGGSIKSFCL